LGKWTPATAYGYARGELHALARLDGRFVGHAATARRFIGVGDGEVLVAGTGGVLTDPSVRGRGVGRQLLSVLQAAHRGPAPAQFGLLGCREEVVGFYRACGYVRIDAEVRDLSPRDGRTVVDSSGPTMVCAGTEPVGAWPPGAIDLRELPW
jgi:aminoglycoside 2'-N-acetyltransferase I